MSEERSDRPFPTPPFRVQGSHPADMEPQTSWSQGGLRRLGAVVKRLDRDAAELAAWWAETRPILKATSNRGSGAATCAMPAPWPGWSLSPSKV